MTRSVALHLGSEFIPVIAFYAAYHVTDFATSAAILAGTTAVATALSVATERRIPIVSVSSSVFVVGAGLLSYLFSNPNLLIIADSLYYFTAAGIIAVGLWRRHYILAGIFAGALTLTPAAWRTLSWYWVGAATLAGIGNELVRHYATHALWVEYKLLKLFLIFAFVAGSFFLARCSATSLAQARSPLTSTIQNQEIVN